MPDVFGEARRHHCWETDRTAAAAPAAPRTGPPPAPTAAHAPAGVDACAVAPGGTAEASDSRRSGVRAFGRSGIERCAPDRASTIRGWQARTPERPSARTPE